MGNCCFNPRRVAVWQDGDEWEEEEFASESKAVRLLSGGARMGWRRR
jgi:hypothetical protein